MKVSYQWLKQYLDLDVKPADLAEKLARTSVDINGVYSLGDGLSNLVVGEIKTCEPHPNSDHLKVCQVDVGKDQPISVICGAPNVQAGKKTIVALPGARIAKGVKIKNSKIRGVHSEGMLCALQEIGFSDSIAPKPYEEGIWFLPDDAKNGESVFPYLGLDDTIIDTDVTPNRGDMLSIYGNVKDIAAFYSLKPHFKVRQVKENGSENASDSVSIKIDDTHIAPTYKLRVVKGVKIADSPLWLQKRLWVSGIRPINNVVDATNYILLKYGQPMHSYDIDQLPGKEFGVRYAKKGEKFTTLDKAEQTLTDKDIVVTVDDQPVCLAGTMGGLATAVTNQTKDVALEAAVFDPILVRKQARRHDLHSESSMRFERGINPLTIETALNEAAALIQEIAGGEVEKGIVTGSEKPAKSKDIDMSLKKVNDTLGTDLSMDTVQNIFNRFDFQMVVKDDDHFIVTVPARRWDISIPADLNEEIARLYGYDNLPSTLPVMTRTRGGLTPRQRFIRNSRHVMEGLGLNQAFSYSLTTVPKAKRFEVTPTKTEPMKLDYPMSTDHVATRMSIVSGLLDDVAYNYSRKVEDVALYEEGRVFIPKGGERPEEQEHLAGALCGHLTNSTWHDKSQAADFFTMKGIVQRYLQMRNFGGQFTYEATTQRPEMHPGRTADIKLNGKVVGYVGEVHPVLADQLRIPETYVFELNLEDLLKAVQPISQFKPISKYPAITRDVALEVDTSVTNADIMKVIKRRGGAYLKDVHLFDVYEGVHLASDKKSLAYTLTYQDENGTLTEDQVNQAFDRVTKHLTDELGAEIR